MADAQPAPAQPAAPEPGPSTSPAPPPPPPPPPPPAQDNDGDAHMANGDAPEEDPKEQLPEGASEVLYVNNLNEKIKLPIMKQSLKVLFREYGHVLGITAHSNVRMRGQAFVTLDSKEAAAKAVTEVQKFPLYGRAMQLAFARTESDILVQKRKPDAMDEHKKERLERKKESRRNDPARRKKLAQRAAAKQAAETGVAPVAAAATAPRRIVQMPDEYLPPNKILFVQNLPDDTTKEKLEALFRPYPNLLEVRTIPGRRNIAFVEFEDESSSAVARDALHNTKFGTADDGTTDEGLKIKVTFAKKG
ncbi:RNA binding protein [Rhodotorula diobovata]|uniref:RNA binding protein n=1 Tax=Rhodotorula diobovata TaxID=5288 RepID=A0A5C5FPM0_9BASI|nr:RNA binding protein [Rhodotorula diobovata]